MQPHVMLAEGDGVGEETPREFCSEPQVPVLAELLCSESPIQEMDETEDPTTSVQSYFDPALLHHPEVLGKLKFLEGQNRQPRDYFQSNPKDEILPYMRKVVSMWMLEVCEEQSCEDNVFPLAAAILDQFLGCTKIKPQQLQLVGCVCLLLASKTRQESHFSLQLLSWYTENSVSLQTLMTWELMILSQLNWDINIITATDFVDFLLARTPSSASPTHKDTQLIRRHAITFISMCCTEPRFAPLSPSLIAASSIYTALKGIRRADANSGSTLASMAGVSVEELIVTAKSIDQVISKELAGIEQTLDRPLSKTASLSSTTVPLPGTGGPPPPSSSSQGKCSTSCGGAHYSSSSTSLTPTDVQDIFC